MKKDMNKEVIDTDYITPVIHNGAETLMQRNMYLPCLAIPSLRFAFVPILKAKFSILFLPAFSGITLI